MHSRPLAALAALLLALSLAASAQAVTNPQIPGLQVALKEKGLYAGRIDGIAGPRTARAVRTFQRRAGIAVDGIAGPQTRKKLGRLGKPLFGRRMIARGSVGWDVSVLEFYLARRGFHPGLVDGRFSATTARALRRYQRRKGLVADGVAGPRTLKTLGVRMSPKTRKRKQPAAGSTHLARSGGRSVRDSLTYWSRHYRLERKLVFALAWQESGFQPNVRSSAGAWGVMQVTPPTWRYVENFLVGENVPKTSDGNVRVGVAYLRHLHYRFRGSERLALAAYYQGPTGVQRHGLYPETRRFVANVRALKRRF